MDQPTTIVAVQVGNTRTRFALTVGLKLDGEGVSLPNTDLAAVAAGVEKLLEDQHQARVVIASVNPLVADELERRIAERTGDEVYRVGRDLPIPIKHTLDDDRTVGQDRLLCAIGAYATTQQACVVIDAGTAVTVDFVDGEGTFHGGVIAPGLNMMLRAMHEQTAALPLLTYEPQDPARGVFGKDTSHAMQLGVANMVRGLVQRMVEQYAGFYEAYPQIVATGGDAQSLFKDDEFVEHIVPDLQLLGIARACAAELEEGDQEGDKEGDEPASRRGDDGDDDL